MTATMEQIKDRIRAIFDQKVDGIVKVYTKSLRNANQWPLGVVFTDAASDSQETSGMNESTRTFRLIVLSMPLELGQELLAEDKCDPFFDRMRTVFNKRPTLWLNDVTDQLAGVSEAKITGDTGFVALQLAGKTYGAVEFTLTLDITQDICYDTP